MLQDGCLQVGDAPIKEPGVGAGGLQPFLQHPVLCGEFAGALAQGGIRGCEARDGMAGLVGFQVTDATQQVRDCVSLWAATASAATSPNGWSPTVKRC
ncbi:hypothetical protein [Micromonospora thermarum]|uniref:Uncharacterized protein n=1 Tax=Micromonospora thermarum TaxID=2720024 RepID=A0ABX0ZDF9_9ACTN|nr:hypothetical protein [Micromonospora thermarum]NJP35897.1 hypothetical protein [Micromonospora thermarum]